MTGDELELKPTALQTVRQRKGRHPMLGLHTKAFAVYREIERQAPSGTVHTVMSALGMKYDTARELIRRLKKEGLVVTTGSNSKGVHFLATVRENETGSPRDEVTVMVTISVNEFGEYSADVKVQDQSPLALSGTREKLITENFRIKVPRPTEPYATRQIFADRPKTKNHRLLTIDHEP